VHSVLTQRNRQRDGDNVTRSVRQSDYPASHSQSETVGSCVTVSK